MKTHKTEHFVIKRYADGKIYVNRKHGGYNLVILDAALAGELADGLLAILTAEERQAHPEAEKSYEVLT